MLLAFDLDNTIVTPDNLIPDAILDAIARARSAGHLIAVLTGRPLASALPHLERLGLEEHYSVNHGALVIGAGGSVLRHHRLNHDEVLALLSPHAAGSIEFSCVVDDTLYVRDPSDARWAWAHTANRSVQRWDPTLRLIADKVVFSTNGESGTIEQSVREAYPHLDTYLWGDGFLEVTAGNADKGSALELLCLGLDVRREETIAFGDGLNDITMMRWAGRAVAVSELAHPEVVALADEHIAGPEHAGVAGWLASHLL